VKSHNMQAHHVSQSRQFDPHEFIVNSNSIDKQFNSDGTLVPGYEPGDILYDNTLKVINEFAVLAAERPTPIDLTHRIHRTLLSGVKELEDAGIIGCYRSVGVRIGDDISPKSLLAQRIIEEKLIPEIEEKRQGDLSKTDAALFAWRCHHLFECAHPYKDGNGRTGRLLLNLVRSCYSLPGLVIDYDKRDEYYRSIQRFRYSEFGAVLSELGCSADEISELSSEEKSQDRRLSRLSRMMIDLGEEEEKL